MSGDQKTYGTRVSHGMNLGIDGKVALVTGGAVRLGDGALPVVADLTKPGDIAHLRERVIAELGPPQMTTSLPEDLSAARHGITASPGSATWPTQ